MNNAPVASGLLLAALAFALAFLPRRTAVLGIAIAVGTAVLTAFLPSEGATDFWLAGCWVSLIIAALSVYFPRFAIAHPAVALAFSANAGGWAGMVLASSQSAAQLWAALAALGFVIPAYFCVRRGWTIAPRIVTSWLVAVALLVGSIPHLVEHPGYVADHRM